MDVQINRMAVTFSYERICQDFEVLLIRYDNPEYGAFGRVINAIYAEIKPLSLSKEAGYAYYVLLPKGQGRAARLEDDHFVIREQDPRNIKPLHLARLLIGALPVLSDSEERFCEKLGLYYLVECEEDRGVPIIRTFQIVLEEDQQGAETIVVNLTGTTFIPLAYYQNRDGSLPPKVARLPRFYFDEFSQEMKKDLKGDFICRGHKTKRMKSQVVSLDRSRPHLFWQSKLGVLKLFLDDVKRYLGSYITYQLETIESDYRVYFSSKKINDLYKKIDSVIRMRPFNIVNLSDVDPSKLIEFVKKDQLNYAISTELDPKAFNLVIHHSPQYYADRYRKDPYQDLHRENVVVQSIMVENIESTEAYEACKKEFAIKEEILRNQFLLISLEGTWTFIKREMRSILDADGQETKEKEAWHHLLEVKGGQLSYRSISPNDDSFDEVLITLPIVEGDQWEYAICHEKSGTSYIIQETNYVELPDFESISEVMKELEVGHDTGILREWIEEFLALLKSSKLDIKASDEQISDLIARLERLLDLSKKRYFKEDWGRGAYALFYRGVAKSFFDWLYAEKRILLGASLQGKQGYMNAAFGLFYNNREKLYYVGAQNIKEKVSQFCVLRRIITDAESVPDALLEMMTHFHIRHKNSTVYPFPFKHLREYQKLNA